MDNLISIQQQLKTQLEQIDALIASQIPQKQIDQITKVFSKEEICVIVEECIQKHGSTRGFGSEIMEAIASVISESDQAWLNSNFHSMIPFLKTPEGAQVIYHVLDAYKIYKGKYVDVLNLPSIT